MQAAARGPDTRFPAGLPAFPLTGIRVSALGFERTLGLLLDAPRRGHRLHVHFTTAHLLTEASDDQELAAALNRPDSLVTPDGMPLVWLGRLKGAGHLDRVYGPDVMLALFDRGREQGARHFLYGGAPGVAEKLKARMEMRFPGVQIAGTYSPPFRPLTPQQDAEVVRLINESRADYVWVGLGAPKQDHWVAEHREKLNAPVLLAVGAAFDFHAGVRRQAPRPIRMAGFEWLFRVLTEPRRLWRRYTVTNARFLWLLLTYNEPAPAHPDPPRYPDAPDPYPIYGPLKRAIDVVGASAVLALASPILAVGILASALSTRASPIYSQVRSGLGGEPFRVFKLRTMPPGADQSVPEQLNTTGGAAFKADEDPRVTRAGKILRKLSLDEIPQLFNVLRGEMSLVGPRPLPLHETARLRRSELRRLAVKPGLTGIWQVSGRSDIGHKRWMAMDRLYIRRRSIRLDLWLILRTPAAILSMRGAR